MSEMRKFSNLVTVQGINYKPQTVNTFTIWLVNGGVGNWIWTIIIVNQLWNTGEPNCCGTPHPVETNLWTLHSL